MTLAKYISPIVQKFRLRGPLAADPTARMLQRLIVSLLALASFSLASLVPFSHTKILSFTFTGSLEAALIGMLVLVRRGFLRAACFVYLSGLWLFATVGVALNGGIRSPGQVLLVTLPVSAAWLQGTEAALWTAGACLSTSLVFAVLEFAGVNLPVYIPMRPLGVWAVVVWAVLLAGVPVAEVLRSLRNALARSRRAEDESRRTMERLRTEIGEHKRTERALRESEERFRISADAAPVMILTRDANQNATFFNKRWLDFTGRSPEQELGTGWTEGMHPDDLESYLAEISAAYAERKEYELQFRLRRADGEYRLLLSHGVPRFEQDRTFNAYIASCTDITDLKRSQEEALARQKWESLGVLAGGIAHDFNNLLGGISAQSELLLKELKDVGSRDSVWKIQSVATRAAGIVRQLMVYAGQESATLEQIDLAALVRDMLPLMKVSASKNAALEVYLPFGLPTILGNVAQVRQVLLNLVTNASEALEGKPGEIRITLTETDRGEAAGDQTLKPSNGHYLRLEVSDTGCGMTDPVRAAIFDPFFTTKGAGRGLGLAAVQGIVRGHGGGISVVSNPGRGSRFEILLPCATNEEPASIDEAESISPDSAERFTGTVLMIEDEEMLRRAVAKLLRAEGLRVLETGDGRAAVELFRTHASEIDITLLDTTLPGFSGREVLQKLRGIRPAVKVIITSAYGKDRALETVKGEPWQPYIRKPYRVNELLHLIRKTYLNEPDSPAAQRASSSGSA